MIILPRQARDTHRESKKDAFLQGEGNARGEEGDGRLHERADGHGRHEVRVQLAAAPRQRRALQETLPQ